MTSKELRQKFIDYFVLKGHKELPPASLIPENDPSVLFTTAGMQQFKRFYTHPEEAPAKNIVTCQPCFRTSDIEEVGDDTHLTFFEMLGNFSFGGYFKEDAIKWGYEFLTKELEIEPDRIWCSIFSGDETNPRDNESAKILESMGLKFKEHSREDNFWGPTGNEGPCGSTVEFYISSGSEKFRDAEGGHIDDIEVWNLVFNEYYKNPDGSYRPLDTKGVDTGMGLERMLVVLNSKNDVYETDVFSPIFEIIEETLPLKRDINTEYIRIVADHIKAAIFLTNDGVMPGNKKQNAILRRLIRLAVQYSDWEEDNLWIEPLVDKIIELYKQKYNFNNIDLIKKTISEEVTKFNNILKYAEKELKDRAADKFSIDDAFFMSQSQGVPFEIYNDYAAMKKVKLDKDNFYQKLQDHQDLSRTASAGMFKGGLASGGEIETKFHTATHLLLAALREILGQDVNQKGANITAERIRFDFNYPEKLTDEQIKKIENWVNDKISQNLGVTMEEMPLEKALKSGATSIPGFKYPETVKVFSIGTVSKEICGGPHVKNTSELGHFKILKEESSSADIRRIKAILK